MKIAKIVVPLVFFAGCCAGADTKSPTALRQPGAVVRGGEETRDQCLKAIKRARLDARRGSYRMYVFGRDRFEEKFSRVVADLLRARYGIELVVSESDDAGRSRCYSNEMDKIIFNSFGPDILVDAEREAREALDSRK